MSAGDGNDPRRLFRPRRPEDFDALYAGTPPWDIGRPQPGVLGPRRITRDELRGAFADGWEVDAIEPATIDAVGRWFRPGLAGNHDPQGSGRTDGVVASRWAAELDGPATGVEGRACVSPCS